MIGSKLRKVFWISLAVKLFIAAVLPLTSDEAYYWVWSEHLQLSYHDHPPMVAWLFWLGQFTDWFSASVRWPAVVMGHAGLALWLVVLRPFLDERQRLYWLWLALLSPLLGGTNIIVTPDLPLMFFYALGVWTFFRWQERKNRLSALFFGLSFGLGFSSKYVMVLLPLSLLPLLFLNSDLRRLFFRHVVWILVGFVAGALPVWLWNFLNDFSSIKFQLAHGLGRKQWKPSWTMHYILGQVALIFPLVLYWAVAARDRLPKIFHFLAWVPLGFFLCTTPRGYVEANWPIVAYPAVFALAASWVPVNLKSLRITAGLWALLLSALTIVVLTQPGWSAKMKSREFYQFDQLIPMVSRFQPLYVRSYQMAAKLHFETRQPVYKLRGMNRRDFYDYIDESLPKEKRFYVLAEQGDRLPDAFVRDGYQILRITELDERMQVWEVETP